MEYKLIVLDMDGTLLNSKSEVSEVNKMALKEAIKAEVNVAIATGRVYTSARYYAELLGINTPIIACNGALIRNHHSNEVIYSSDISYKDSLKIIEICKKYNLYFHYYDEDYLYVEVDKVDYLFGYYWKGRGRNKEAESFKTKKDLYKYVEINKNKILKFVMVDEDRRKLDRIRKEFEKIKGVELDQSWHNNLEIMNKGVSKGAAIEKLSKLLNIQQKNIIAFGDNYNDLSMKDYVKTFVAMGNGEEKVKEQAAYITASNDENGVAEGICKLVLKEEALKR